MIHLHVHTVYSVLDGLSHAKEYAAKAKSFGMDALAITDHGNLGGILQFDMACKEAGIKSIFGSEFYIVPKLIEKDRQRWHIVLLAKNQTGLKNLIKLSSLSHTEGFYYKPRITHEWLGQHSKGLICMSACEWGEIPNAILNGDQKRALKRFDLYQEIFGDDFYLEMMPHDDDRQRQVNQALMKLDFSKLIITSDCHYAEPEDARYHKYLLMLQTQKAKAKGGEVFEFKIKDLYLRDHDDMLETFVERNPAIPKRLVREALARTEEISNGVKSCIIESGYKIPLFSGDINFEVPEFR